MVSERRGEAVSQSESPWQPRFHQEERERERLWIWITVNPLINPFFKAWKNWIDDKMDFKIDRIFLFSNYLF